MKYQEALKETMEHFGLSAREVSLRAGIQEAAFSQFRNGKKDINLETWERLINGLPVEAQKYIYLKVLIGNLDNRGISALLSAISSRLLQESQATESQDLVLI